MIVVDVIIVERVLKDLREMQVEEILDHTLSPPCWVPHLQTSDVECRCLHMPEVVEGVASMKQVVVEARAINQMSLHPARHL